MAPGDAFGRWVLLQSAPPGRRGSARWWARCACGTERVVRAEHLKSGRSRSCGCWSRDLTVARSTTHGGKHGPEYRGWADMIQRCTNPQNPGYPNYGGRGITLDPTWRQSFAAFLSAVGPRPGPGYSVDRMDNNRGYEPGNVRWATPRQQMRNQRTNRLITVHGQTRCLSEWAELLGIPVVTLHSRLGKLGWPVERAIPAGAFDRALAERQGGAA